MILSSHQKKYLRALANIKKPVLTIGQKGITEEILLELATILSHHELFKVKIRADKSSRPAIIKQLLAASEAKYIQAVGGILVLYKPYPKHPVITLPKI